jgi:hypothetical protein
LNRNTKIEIKKWIRCFKKTEKSCVIVLAFTAELAAENKWRVTASGDESFANDVCMLKNVALLIMFQTDGESDIRIDLYFGSSDRLQCIECRRFVMPSVVSKLQQADPPSNECQVDPYFRKVIIE